ncbi:MAG: phosphoribosyl-AMP cyclohydrolase [Eubacterium sp.]|nr:phosphoribosyl-AMP cyclohydrolase [Eubacterium sp.]
MKTEIKDVKISDVKLKFDEKGLIPAIAQDFKTGEVLMLAYMNEESFNLTLKTGKATYFSRSRQSLWLKGETSGHFQHVKEIRFDCDSDTLLLLIEQEGAACHTGSYSCFFRRIEDIDDIKETNSNE